MNLCYVDESGVPEIPGNTSHFILAGISIPVSKWREYDNAVETIKTRYGLAGQEAHVAWMMRPYREQTRITGFDALPYDRRRAAVLAEQTREIHRLQRLPDKKLYHQTRKNYLKTAAYIHLTRAERVQVVTDIAACIAGWSQARLFAECIDKAHFTAQVRGKTPDVQAFEQLVSRFEQFLQNSSRGSTAQQFGLLIHDNNQTVARRHTELMRAFHSAGTVWTGITRIIETPLYVDSQLTSMVQIADLCAYALRRYVENGEDSLFDFVFQRADRIGPTAVGVRHFTQMSCACKICAAHRRPSIPTV